MDTFVALGTNDAHRRRGPSNRSGGRILVTVIAASLTLGAAQCSDETEQQTTATFTDFVSIGDSFASGEGSPVPYDLRNTSLDVTLVNTSADFPPPNTTEEVDFREFFGGFPRAYAGLESDGEVQGQFDAQPDWTRYYPVQGFPGAPYSFPCHRSPYNGRALAYLHLRSDFENFAGDFFDLACSGATIANGLLDTQETNQGNQGPTIRVPAQMDAIDRMNLDNWVLLVSIGVNDIGFGPIVSHCLASPALFPCDPSTIEEFVETGNFPPLNPLGWLLQPEQDLPGLLGLEAAFDNLAEAVRFGPGLDDEWEPPKQVLVSTYPTPNGSLTTGYCDQHADRAEVKLLPSDFAPLRDLNRLRAHLAGDNGGPALVDREITLGGVLGPGWTLEATPVTLSTEFVTAEDSQFLDQQVLLQLNAAIERIVEDLDRDDIGWQIVDMYEDNRWLDHAWCSEEEPYFNSLRATFERQGNHNGIMHPNCVGHMLAANILYPSMVQAAGLQGSVQEPYPQLPRIGEPVAPCRIGPRGAAATDYWVP